MTSLRAVYMGDIPKIGKLLRTSFKFILILIWMAPKSFNDLSIKRRLLHLVCKCYNRFKLWIEFKCILCCYRFDFVASYQLDESTAVILLVIVCLQQYQRIVL